MKIGVMVDDRSHLDVFATELLSAFPSGQVDVLCLRESLAGAGREAALSEIRNFVAGRAVVFNRLNDDLRRQAGHLGEVPLTGEIGEMLQSLPKLVGRPGRYSLCGDRLPLNLQWLAVREIVPGLDVPRFEYAFGANAPEIDGFERPIAKDVFDFLRWREDPSYSSRWNQFVVDRPRGEPYAVALIGDNALVHPMGKADTSRANVLKLSAAAKAAARALNHQVGGCLLFQDGEKLTFAALTPDVGVASPCGGFSRWVKTSAIQVLSKYLH